MDCTTNCKFQIHGTYLTSAVTALSISDLKERLKSRCSNITRNTDCSGRNVMHVAASCGRVDLINWLCEELKGHIFLQMKDKESGWTALHRACYYGQINCIIAIQKILSDWSSVDFEGHTPLDLVLLDSPRTKKRRKRKENLAVVTFAFEAGDIGELTLNVGNILEILHVNKSGWGVGKIKESGQKGLFPVNFVEEMKLDVPVENLERHDQQDVYVWGNNVDFTLGLGDAKNRQKAELIEQLWEYGKSFNFVCLSKFHSVFLTTNNEVYTCGHGLGGRLGQSNEETSMIPKKISMPNNLMCLKISAATHYTLVLDDFSQVWSFGLNDFHQLGHTPPPKMCISPTLVSYKFLKDKRIIGIGAARFHSVIHTKYELYTFGLNAGQLGHTKGDQLQTMPKLVSQLYRKDTSINHVVVSDGATLCSMLNGDIYVLQDYVCRKIAIKMVDVTQLCMSGGLLDFKGIENHSPEPLRIAVLRQSGIVESWKLNYKGFKQCYWLGNALTKKRIVSIALGKHLLLTTDDGQVYIGHFHTKDTSINKITSCSNHVSIVKPEVSSGNYTLKEVIESYKEKRKDYEEVHVLRVPLLYRSLKCFCDSKSKVFAVIQADPRTGITKLPLVKASSMCENFHGLLTEATLSDKIHDAIVKVTSNSFPVHQFILECRLQSEKNIFSRKEIIGDKVIYSFINQSDTEVKAFLSKVYKGNIETLPIRSREKSVDKNIDEEVHLTEMLSLTKVDMENPADGFSKFVDDDSSQKLQKRRKHKKKSAYAVHQLNNELPNISEVVKRRTKQLKKSEVKLSNFENWEIFDELSDITIESQDGKLLKCHKCVLISRLDYFNNMLNNEWLESSNLNGILKMHIPYDILKVVIDYLYTDKAKAVEVSSDISFVGEVLVCADQLLISRLKDICELALADKVCLKNAVELFRFSCMFNVQQLKMLVCEFISLNLPYYLNARLLEELSNEELQVLSTIYKAMVVGMETRYIKPSSYHDKIDEEEKLLEDKLKIEFNKRKQQQRRRRTLSSESDKRNNSTSSFTEDVCKKERNISCSSIGEDDERGCLVEHELKKTPVSATKTAWNLPTSFTCDISVSNEVKNKTLKDKPSPFKKMSQKERRQLIQNKEISITEEKSIQPVQNKNTKMAWGQVSQTSSSTQSFKDLMSSEKLSITPSKSFKKSLVSPRRSVKPLKESRLSLNPSEETRPTIDRNNPWQKLLAPTYNDQKEDVNVFSTILNAQQEEKKELHLQSKIPLTVIQLEERAMLELKTYYERNATYGEYITVDRVKGVTDLPFWDRVLVE